MRLFHISETTLACENIKREFCVKIFIMNVVKQLKIYGFGEVSSTNCLKQTSANQEYLISQSYFQANNSYTFPKAILHKCQKCVNLNIFKVALFIVYQMRQCIDCAMFLSTEKQSNFGSFVNNNIPQNPDIKYRESGSLRCILRQPMDSQRSLKNHMQFLKERQMKYPKIVEVLNLIFLLDCKARVFLSRDTGNILKQ